MRAHKRSKLKRENLNSRRLRSHEILCEECGTVYDRLTDEGLCHYCAEGIPQPHPGAPRKGARTGIEETTRDDRS